MVSRRDILGVAVATVIIVLALGVVYYYYVEPCSHGGPVVTGGSSSNGDGGGGVRSTPSSSTSVVVRVVETGPLPNSPLDFSPLNFTVTEGEQVTISFNNTDTQAHELVIPQFDVTTGVVNGGSTVSISFTPEEIGSFAYFQPMGPCSPGNPSPSIACPRMEIFNGTMTVLPAPH
jgi:plastocyanin